jgi:DNA-binding GntR family transcriptional regulator
MDRDPPQQIARVLLASEAATVLRQAILQGHLAQGERVNEVRLSESLGISRGPLREALRRLEQDGLVTSLPHRGASIVRVSPQDVMDVLSVRKLLEPHAIATAIAKRDAGLLEELRAANVEMQQAASSRDPVEIAAAHGRFHSAFYRHSGNRMLAGMWRRLEDPVRLYLLRRQSTFGDMSEVAGAHDRLLGLAEQGDGAAAQSEILSHLSVNMDTISRLLQATGRETAIHEPVAGA